MKRILLPLAFLTAIAFSSVAQEFPKNEEGKIVYEEVVNVEGATKDQLFRQARHWHKETYMNDGQDKDVVYLMDSYLGEIAANPLMWMNVGTANLAAGAVLYEIMVTVKEGRYKYKIYRFSHESQRSRLGSGGALENSEPECGVINMQQSYWDEIKVKTDEKIKELIAKMKESMSQAPENSENEDW